MLVLPEAVVEAHGSHCSIILTIGWAICTLLLVAVSLEGISDVSDSPL